MEGSTIYKRKKFIINVVYFFIVIFIAYAILKYAIPLLLPFVIGFFIAVALQRPIKYLTRCTLLNHKICAVIMSVIFYAAFVGVVMLLGEKTLDLIKWLILIIPEIYSDQIAPALTEFFNGIESFAENNATVRALLLDVEEELATKLNQLITTITVTAVTFISNLATAIPGLFIKLVLMIISSVFIAMDYEKLMGFCVKQMGTRTRTIFFEIKNYVVGTLFVVIRSYALIMSITFVELSIGLTILGIEHPVLIAACISVFDILPVLGTGGIMLPWAVFTLIRGKASLALGLVLVYVTITIIRNILEPKIVGSQLGLHPIVTLSSMFAGVQLLGVVGLFGFPIFLSLICHLDKKGVINVFKKEEEQIA